LDEKVAAGLCVQSMDCYILQQVEPLEKYTEEWLWNGLTPDDVECSIAEITDLS
jgi:hypothetical protein